MLSLAFFTLQEIYLTISIATFCNDRISDIRDECRNQNYEELRSLSSDEQFERLFKLLNTSLSNDDQSLQGKNAPESRTTGLLVAFPFFDAYIYSFLLVPTMC